MSNRNRAAQHFDGISRIIIQDKNVPFTATSTEQKLLDRVGVVDNLRILITGTDTITGATTRKTMGMWNLVKNLRLKVNGKTIVSVPGSLLFHITAIETGNRPLFNDVTAGISAAFNYAMSCVLPFNGFFPFLSALDTTENAGGVTEFLIEVDWNDSLTSCYTVASGTVVHTTGPTLTVYQERFAKDASDGIAYGAPGTPGYTGGKVRQLLGQNAAYTGAANPDLRIPLTKNFRYSRLILQTLDAGVPSDAILTPTANVSVFQGSTEILRVLPQLLKALQFERYNVPLAEQSTIWTGVYVLDFAKAWNETQWWDGADFELRLNLAAASGGSVLTIVSDRYTDSPAYL